MIEMVPICLLFVVKLIVIVFANLCDLLVIFVLLANIFDSVVAKLMSVVKRNAIANILGSVWGSLIGIIFVPVFLHFLGAEGYGMIGFFTTMTTLFSVLELGIGAAAARELARISARSEGQSRHGVQNLVESFELIVYGIGVVIGAAAFLSAPLICDHWLKGSQLSRDELIKAIQIQSVLFGLYFPNSLYGGCLSGQQRQVLNNWLGVIINTARSAGGGLVLWIISPTLEAFLYWQLVIGIIGIIVLRVAVWVDMPVRWRVPRLDWKELNRVKEFALGVATGNLFGLIVMYMDKFILSTLLPLEEYGYYTIGWTLSVIVMRLALPISTAVGPRLTQLVAEKNDKGSVDLYHTSSQYMAMAVVPVSVSIAFFSHDTLLLWTQNPSIASAAQWPLALLCFGNMLNAMTYLPYSAQIAHGWTSLSVRTNLSIGIFVVPLAYFLATRYGLIGAALIWPMVNITYLIAYVPIMHRRIMIGEGGRWLRESVVSPVLVTAVVVGGLFWLHAPAVTGRSFSNIVTLCVVGLFSLLVSALVLPAVRRYAFSRIW